MDDLPQKQWIHKVLQKTQLATQLDFSWDDFLPYRQFYNNPYFFKCAEKDSV